MRCAILTSMLLAVSCAPAPAPEASRALIFGGERVAEGEHPAVVALAYRKTSAEPWRLECSGALVAPRTVLTAGHCVAPLVGEIAVYVGTGHEGGVVAQAGDGLRAVERVEAHPHLRAHPLGYADYGVVLLKDDVEGIAPLPLAATLAERRATTAVGRELTVVGYGRREDDGTGVKMQVTTTVTRATAQEIVLGGEGRDACTGDSGGPVLARDEHGRWTLAGVVSRGLKLACGEGGYAGVAADALCWLDDSCYGEPSLAALGLVLGTSSDDETTATLATTTKLDLTGAMLDDVSLLPALAPNLERLTLDGNRLRSVAPLAKLSSLKTLSLVGNDAVDLESLSPLAARGVTILGLRRQLSNYTATPFLTACQDAATPAGARHTIKAVLFRTMAEDCALANQRLLLLKTFALKDRGIIDVTPLAHLQGLETLDLSLNPGLEEVSALAGLESLKKLDLTGTGVADVSALQPLVSRGLLIVR